MFSKKSVASEIEKSMANAMEPANDGFNKVAEAVEHLNVAAELLDGLGLSKEAECATILLEVIAAKKSKKKSKKNPPAKSKKPAKKQSKKPEKSDKMVEHDPAMAGLTSEKMLDNIAHKGWMFNVDDDLEVDDSDADDFNFDFDTSKDSGYTMKRDDDNYSEYQAIDDDEEDLDSQWERVIREIEHARMRESERAKHRHQQHFMLPPQYDEIEMPSIPSSRPDTKSWQAIEEASKETIRPPKRY